MLSARSTVARSYVGYVVAICVVSLSTILALDEGRKCACTSKACKEAGVDTCRTNFSCYTELILTAVREFGENTTTRGCTEGATPLLCETKSWSVSARSTKPAASLWVRAPWPRLRCCDSHDYCNADLWPDADARTREEQPPEGPAVATGGATVIRDTTMRSDWVYEEPRSAGPVKRLYVAAVILAVAALISVLAACYVITRFLKSDRHTMAGTNQLRI